MRSAELRPALQLPICDLRLPKGSVLSMAGCGPFHPVRRPALPQSPPGGAPTHNPIDAFVLARLEEKGLGPSPPASKGELIRRLYFDLIGLPPAPEDIRAFFHDASAGAYERLVDR